MSLFNSMNISASGLTAQRLKMDVISQNIANATTTRTAEGGPYQRRAVILETSSVNTSFSSQLDRAMSRTDRGVSGGGGGVRVSGIVADQTPGVIVHDPTHPHANEDGYVIMPNVNIIEEMVNMISASRAYEANMTGISMAQAMIARTLELSAS